MNDKQQAELAAKKFREYLREEVEPDWAALKRAERAEKYQMGWTNFGVTCPTQCATMLKNAYEKYRQANPDQFPDDAPAGTENA